MTNQTIKHVNSRNGTVTLTNGLKFHASGRGHATNSDFYLAAFPSVLRDANKVPVEDGKYAGNGMLIVQG